MNKKIGLLHFAFDLVSFEGTIFYFKFDSNQILISIITCVSVLKKFYTLNYSNDNC